MAKITAAARAKINLTLDILSKRPDGYHEIETVMHSVSLEDEVTGCETGGGGIRVLCDDLRLPQGGDIVYRAAARFFEYTGINNTGISFEIKKKIPLGAGLAGGSADAAAALVILDRLFSSSLSKDELIRIASGVGADVPFCLTGGCMAAAGVGDRLKKAPPLPECSIVIAKPPESVSTTWAYGAFDRAGKYGSFASGAVLKALVGRDLTAVSKSLHNAFEDVVGLDSVAVIKKTMLASGAAGASMTGSGSAVFGLFFDADTAEDCRDELLIKYKEVFVCRPAKAGVELRRY